jgi:hypothetical protein
MWFFSQTSSAARTALAYITVGALIVIWTGVWYVYLHNNPPDITNPYYWCGGLFLTGITLIVIGFGLGRIGRSARHAETSATIAPSITAPPPNVTPDSLLASTRVENQADPKAKRTAPIEAPVAPR